MGREIFISYSRHDKSVVLPYVKQISEAVERECWIDLKGIESGVEFEEVIIRAIDECQVVLFMLSDSSLHSKWTKREVIYAEDEGKRIVPILVDGENLRGWFKFHFGSVDFIDIQSEEQKEKLVSNLRTWLGVDETERKVEEEVRLKAEEDEAERKAEEEARQKAEKEAKRKEEARRKAEEEAKPKAVVTSKSEEENNNANSEKNPSQKWIKTIGDIWKSTSNPLKWGMIIALITVLTFTSVYLYLHRIVDYHGASEGMWMVNNGLGKYGFSDDSGNMVIPCQWKRACHFSEGLAMVTNENDKDGFIDKTGKVVIPCNWNFAESFSEGLAVVEDANYNYGFIDKTGKVVIPCKWNRAESFSEGLAVVQDKKEKFGFIDKTGKVVIPCNWNYAYSFSESLAVVQDKKEKYGVINKTGKMAVPCQWESIDHFCKGLSKVKDAEGKFGCINKTGKVVVACKWEDVWIDPDDGSVTVTDKSGKMKRLVFRASETETVAVAE